MRYVSCRCGISDVGERAGVVVRAQQGADPAAVALDALAAARNRKVDVLLVDMAGRLQTRPT